MILKIDREGEIEIGSVIKCRHDSKLHVGEVYGYVGDKSYEIILYDKRLKPIYKLDGSFRRKRVPIERCKLIDETFTFNTKGNYELGDVVQRKNTYSKPVYGVIIGFTHPDGLFSTSYEHGYNGTDLVDCVEIEKRGLTRKRTSTGEIKRFSINGDNLRICEVDLWNKTGPKITTK